MIKYKENILKETKNINVEVSYECWKKLKMLSIHRDTTMQEVVKDLLDKSLLKKGNQVEEIL